MLRIAFSSSSSLVASRLLHTKSNIYRVKRFTCHFIVVLAEETLYSHASIWYVCVSVREMFGI